MFRILGYKSERPVFHCTHCREIIEHDEISGWWVHSDLARKCSGGNTTALPIFEEHLNPVDRAWLADLKIKVEPHG